VYSIAPFFAQPPDRAGLVLGYSGLAEKPIAEGIALFGKALRTGS
jgi:DNA-binding transcriptional MocR family regulator